MRHYIEYVFTEITPRANEIHIDDHISMLRIAKTMPKITQNVIRYFESFNKMLLQNKHLKNKELIKLLRELEQKNDT